MTQPPAPTRASSTAASPVPPAASTAMPGARMVLAVIATGIMSGLGGMALALALHAVQHVAYGYGQAGGPHNFLAGVSAAPPWRRVAALFTCGVVAGFGWWGLQRAGRPLVSVTAAVGRGDAPGKAMPAMSTTIHVLLQIVTVALGSPLGREVAPREFGALLASRGGRLLGLAPGDARIIIACGAGAGLAAVYNVPLAGTLFILEVLLKAFSPRAAMAALGACGIAAVVPWLALGNVQQYDIGPMPLTPAIMMWAICAAPVIGVCAHAIKTLGTLAQNRAASGAARIAWCLAVFTAIGLLACLFPQLPGNGRGPTQLAVAGRIGATLGAELLVLKIVVVMGALRAGAAGGLLTPSLTMGALLSSVLVAGWNLAAPAVPADAAALIGGVAFLGTFMAMPMTALALGIEFTRVGHDMWFPMCLAMALCVAVARGCARLTHLPGPLTRPAAPGSVSARS
ncbi:chloride channel protein [Gluconacetobacter entanii]|uniref:chloride channel protein n=2 Tax=Gluconacetobacter entanii TaxID=108528 RepID=UPI0022356CB1|nr:chloride channel protein [Gluconacetobacter entanii]MCW4581512.1 chloride channel protein [Gluconacetobacter entanii]MCW4584892.1 chloride channel protein [Gluconacetobacter entanii]MCW4588305.1 chloride channel protein [Gluconacetobacter entanii]